VATVHNLLNEGFFERAFQLVNSVMYSLTFSIDVIFVGLKPIIRFLYSYAVDL